MSFQELFTDLQECEIEKLSLLSGDQVSSNLFQHLKAINYTIYNLSQEVFLASKKENFYWSHCSTETYNLTYDDRLKKSLNSDFEKIHNEIEFIESEIFSLSKFESNFSDTNYHHDLIYPIKKKIKLLEYKIEGLKPYIAEDLIDLSGASCTEKVIFLHEVGVLDYLRTLSPFNLSTNKLAEFLSAITGDKPESIQSYINPIYSQNVNQKNNPLNSTSAVNKVSNKLSNMGFSNKKTN